MGLPPSPILLVSFNPNLPNVWFFYGKISQLIWRHSVGGHQGGEQNAMAANGKIDIGCGTLEYTINWPKVRFSLWLPSPFNHSRRCLSSKFLPALVHDYLHQNSILMRVLLLTI